MPSRFPQVNLCARKVPTSLYEYALGGFRTQKLLYTRLEDNLIRHQGDRLTILSPEQMTTIEDLDL